MHKKFDESKHKRDERGRFAEMETSALKERQTLDLSDTPVPVEVYGFANKERKNTKDHKAHAKEMGFKNQDDYEKAALMFWSKEQGIIYKGKRRNDFAKYNEKTRKYVVISKDGYIKTFYLLSNKIFNAKIEQEGYEEWRR